MSAFRCPRVALLAAAALFLVLFSVAATASAATVPLNGRTFDAACKASNAGDVVTVPAGSYGGQSISCTKSVTLQAQGAVTLSSLSFNGANGPTVDGVRVTGSSANGAVSVMKSQNVTVKNSTFNNMVYLEGAVDTLFDHDTWEPADSSTAWSNGDMMDLYEQTRTPTPNTRVTVQDSVFHGLRAPNSAAHSDAIQICNCASSDAQHTIDFKVLRTKFYDNECMNIRTNPQDQVTLENNLFGDTVRGISGCGDFSLDVLAADATVRYNTFYGKQRIQVNATADVGQSQTWVGNAGVGMSTNCGAIRGTYAYNVWTSQKCGSTDKQVSSLGLNADGTPTSTSPVINAGNPSSYPTTDYNRAARPVGGAPDAGAFEYGATPDGGGSDTTAPQTTITTAPTSGTATSASIAFTSSESGSTFQCRIDAGAWGACVSPKGYSGLAVGSHTFDVRATDAAGNVDGTPASATWTVSAPPSGSGLVAAYDFNETSGTGVWDSSGHSLNGTRSGAVSTTSGRFGRGLTFDGVDDRVGIQDNALLDLTNAMTLEAWVYPTAQTGWRTVLAKEQTGGLVYSLYASGGAGQPAASAFTTSGFSVKGPSALPLNAWSHLAVTFDGATLRLYVNGTQVASQALTGPLKTSTGPLRIGGNAIRGEYFKGTLDEVRIYSKALTATQIRTDMNSAI